MASAAPSLPTPNKEEAMTQTSDQNKAATVKFFQEVLTNQNYALIPQMLDPDYRFNGQPQTVAGLTGWIDSIHAAYPGLNFLVEAILAEDESVALRWRMTVPAGVAHPNGGYFIGTNIIVFAGGKAISNDQNDQLGHATFVPNPPSAS